MDEFGMGSTTENSAYKVSSRQVSCKVWQTYTSTYHSRRQGRSSSLCLCTHRT
jgi:hypothetical protein